MSAVGVRIDGGDWQPTLTSQAISDATWVQWMLPWTAAGEHEVEVRAIDGLGDIQTADVTPPDPHGARGHYRVVFTAA